MVREDLVIAERKLLLRSLESTDTLAACRKRSEQDEIELQSGNVMKEEKQTHHLCAEGCQGHPSPNSH